MLRAEAYARIRLLAVDRKMTERQEVIIISDDDEGVDDDDVMLTLIEPVSYTHLTLPTIYSV